MKSASGSMSSSRKSQIAPSATAMARLRATAAPAIVVS